MSVPIDDLESKALDLDPKTRAHLVVRLIRSLDPGEDLSQAEIEKLWLEEAEERRAEDVFAEARNRLTR
jgi:hypothetical protein